MPIRPAMRPLTTIALYQSMYKSRTPPVSSLACPITHLWFLKSVKKKERKKNPEVLKFGSMMPLRYGYGKGHDSVVPTFAEGVAAGKGNKNLPCSSLDEALSWAGGSSGKLKFYQATFGKKRTRTGTRKCPTCSCSFQLSHSQPWEPGQICQLQQTAFSNAKPTSARVSVRCGSGPNRAITTLLCNPKRCRPAPIPAVSGSLLILEGNQLCLPCATQQLLLHELIHRQSS